MATGRCYFALARMAVLLFDHQMYCSVVAAKPQLPADFEATTWSKLREAVQAVHGKRPVSVSLEELYRVRLQPLVFCFWILSQHPPT